MSPLELIMKLGRLEGQGVVEKKRVGKTKRLGL